MISPLRDYYATCAFPKGDRKADARATKGAARVAHRKVVARVKAAGHWGGKCAAHGVSPVCVGRQDHPHELIPRGAGGKVSIRNSVPICSDCHLHSNGQVGGNQLQWNWKGKAEGLKPRADLPGHVWAEWRARRGKRRGDDGKRKPMEK